MDKYPTLSLTELSKLKTVIQNISDDPKYLDGRVCPYDKPVRDMLRSMAEDPIIAATLSPDNARKKPGAPRKGPVIPMGELEQEFQDLRTEINSLKSDAKGLEPHERIQVVKTRAALIEKIISMKERINNLNRNTKFIATVIGLIEDELDQDARLRIIDKLAPFADEE